MAISERLAKELNKRPSFVDSFTKMTLHMQTKACPDHAQHTAEEMKSCEAQRTFTSGTISGAIDLLQACRIPFAATPSGMLTACRTAATASGTPVEYRWMLAELSTNLEAIVKCMAEHPVP